MRIELGLHVVMSGGGGFDLTDVLDFNAFLIDGGNGEWVLFDAGAGRSPNDANAILAADGIDPAAIRHLFLTHCHADHSGGARGVARSARPRRLCWAGDNADGRRRRRGGDQSRASSPGGCLSARLPLSCLSGGPRPRRRRGNDNRPPENQDDRDPGALRRPCFLSGRERWASPAHRRRCPLPRREGALQDIPDCSITDICTTVRKLAAIEFDALLPGHLNFSLRNAHCHAETALAYVEKLRCPPSMI